MRLVNQLVIHHTPTSVLLGQGLTQLLCADRDLHIFSQARTRKQATQNKKVWGDYRSLWRLYLLYISTHTIAENDVAWRSLTLLFFFFFPSISRGLCPPLCIKIVIMWKRSHSLVKISFPYHSLCWNQVTIILFLARFSSVRVYAFYVIGHF